jgi:hypothetical protein
MRDTVGELDLPPAPDIFGMLSWQGWLRAVAVHSLEIASSQPLDLEPPISERQELKTLLRATIREYERLYRWRSYAEPGASATPFKRKAGEMVTRILHSASNRFGDSSCREFRRWCEIVWGDLTGANWDWFAYETAVKKWAGLYIHRGVDIFELGHVGDDLILRFQDICYSPSRHFEAEIPTLRKASLSEWDTYCLQLTYLSLDSEPPDPWLDLVSVLRGALGRAQFQLFWRTLLASLSHGQQVSMHSHVLSVIGGLRTAYPNGRRLTWPWELVAAVS